MRGPRGRGVKGAGIKPRFEYFLETVDQPVAPELSLWRQPLALSRTFYAGSSPAAPGSPISIGDYFEAVRSFLEGTGREAIADCLKSWGAKATAAAAFRIFLSKHGAYYHPGRVEAGIGGKAFCWVVNVAVSAAGRSLLPKEYAALERLNREFPVSHVPEVYASGTVDAGNGRSIDLFLGQWFSGFHEFHLTRSRSDAAPGLVLWDPEKGHRRLGIGQARTIYHQVAYILTHYFNLNTLEGIGAWHHAAGDFVVRLGGARPEVRLITVRQYRPLFRARSGSGIATHDVKRLLETLLIFLLTLSIRTRLDRLDGTGDMTWSDPVAVEATVAGILAALAEKPPPFKLPLPLDPLFRHYLAACSAEDLLELCSSIVSAYALEAPETPLVKARLKEHVSALADALGRR
jgi:hypothetical protein